MSLRHTTDDEKPSPQPLSEPKAPYGQFGRGVGGEGYFLRSLTVPLGQHQ
jgi:hypothetical protein